jgi:hypothetical protein
MAFQPLGITTFIPIYLAIHVLVSPVARSFPGSSFASRVLLVDSYDLFVLPLSVSYGLGLASIMMVMPLRIFSVQAHYAGMVAWRFFPMWTAGLQHFISSCYRLVWRSVFGGDYNKLKASASTPVSQSLIYLSSAKFVFIFVQIACVMSHMSCLIWSIVPVEFLDAVPDWFGPWETSLKGLFAATLPGVFFPDSPLSPPASEITNPVSLAHLAAFMLRWDMYAGLLALLVWAVFLFLNAGSDRGAFESVYALMNQDKLAIGKGQKPLFTWLRFGLNVSSWCLIGGPVAAAAYLLKERDGIVRQKVKMGV